MNVVKLDLYCPACGVHGIYVDQDDAGDYYAGTSHYCMACHAKLPDLGSVRGGGVLLETTVIPLDHWDIGRYLEIRAAAVLGPESTAETERVQAAYRRAKSDFERRHDAAMRYAKAKHYGAQ